MDQTALAEAGEESSSLRGAGGLKEKVEKARLELLDLSTRNRLLHTPRGGRAKTIEVVHELAKAMYQTLVIDGKRFTFVAGKEDPKQGGSLPELDDDDEAVLLDEAPEDLELIAQPDFELDENGRVKAHWDAHLTTRLTPTGLQKRLLDLYTDARTLQEEQGVNVLYLAVGYLRWRATSTPQTDRFAPLVLIPVQLERSTAGEKFHLRWTGDDIQANLSLQLFLQREFGLRLPSIDEFETLDINAYLAAVEAMLEGRATWGVLRDDAILGLFSFAKFMMYRDLDPQSWEALGGLEAIPMLRGVVQDGFPGARLTDEASNLDRIIPPEKMCHVVDCDSSQALVVHDVLQGNNILVQGPPGTGKSQTIANIISAAVAEGKRVLFVAEKMAALEVVKRRLDHVGVGVACLELHSNKANKRSLLEELRKTLNLGDPQRSSTAPIIEQLTERRDTLNAHVARLHEPHVPSALTAYQVFGQLVRLRRLGYTTQSLPLEVPTSWAPHEKEAREALLREMIERVEEIGVPSQHAWSGVQNDGLLPNERDRLLTLVDGLAGRLGDWESSAAELHATLDLPPPSRFDDAGLAVHRVKALFEAPNIGSDALQSVVWEDSGRASAVIGALENAQNTKAALKDKIRMEALAQDWQASKLTLSALPSTFVLGKELATLGSAHSALVRLLPDLTRLTQLLGEKSPLTLDLALRLVAIAERATSIPELDRDALVAHIWERGVDAVEEIVVAVETVQHAKSNLSSVFRDAAWSKDSSELEAARGQLAMRGTSFFRFFSGDWRRANKTVRTLLSDPKLQALDMLGSLDVLLDAKSAQKKIVEHDAQGQEAFGSNWQRERSNPSFLRGVVAWMRNLRPLGSGVRERLADIGDRQLATDIAKRVKPVLEELGRGLSPVHEALLAAELNPWGEETVLKRVVLSDLIDRSAVWQAAIEQTALLLNAGELAVEQALAVIEEVQIAQAATVAYDALAGDGASAFGPLWLALDSKSSELRQVVVWIERNPELRLLATRIEDPQPFLDQAERASSAAGILAGEIMNLLVGLQFEGNAEITQDSSQAPLATLKAQLASWQADPEGLRSWVAYLAIAKEAKRKGLGAVVDALAEGNLAVADALAVFQLSYYEAVLQALVQRDRALASFDGQRQSQVVASFANLDQERMQLARYEVVKAHHSKIPRQGGATRPTAVLIGEMAKKKGHLPIRQLMQRCAPAIQAIKPVFMMSPLSVAQFLPAGALDFDMLVIDEASQVQPIDALGAIARAKQLVVVGDERQLPPTRFFSKALGDGGDREDDEGGAQASDVESILGLCRARGLPERMLRWHYRSRHQSLIAVSNHQFYEGKLFIVPSPYTSEAGVGLRLHHLPEAIYDRGNTRTNPKEAKAVALAVLAHAQSTPQLTLGVATFSTAQRRAILDELELLRRQHPEKEGFFADHPAEPFFVKSLENIQGDERDVIYISVGYGRDAQRHMTMNFGPVSSDGGERRLNVLISRAKSRCEIFTSITDEDIDTDRAKGKGTFALKLFLNYARTGRLTLATEERGAGQSVFEQEVAQALRARGYDLHTDVGLAGFFVDIAISNPDQPGRYILGIECDGQSYRDARSARDRDRLRESVLRDKGWQIYRIWSSDWFHRPEAELEKLVTAIELAKSHSDPLESKAKASHRAVPVEILTVDRGEVAEMGLIEARSPPDTESYIEAFFAVPSNQFELHLAPIGQLATIVRQIVEVESPIHRSEVVTRVRTLWGLQRAGSRIQQAVEEAIGSVVSLGGVQVVDKDFLVIPGKEVRVRDRSMVESLTLRRPEFLPPSEIDSALIKVVQDNLGAKAEELVTMVSRQLGYKSTSPQLRRVILDRCEALVGAGKLVSKGDLLVVP